jgi:hypothetical protein
MVANGGPPLAPKPAAAAPAGAAARKATGKAAPAKAALPNGVAKSGNSVAKSGARPGGAAGAKAGKDPIREKREAQLAKEAEVLFPYTHMLHLAVFSYFHLMLLCFPSLQGMASQFYEIQQEGLAR